MRGSPKHLHVWAAVLAAAVVAVPSFARASTMAFGVPVPVATNELTGEPGIALDPSNAQRVYAIAPGVNGIWFSANGGTSFTAKSFGTAAIPSNAGDSDIAVDANGVVYQSGLLNKDGLNSTIPVAVSTNQGTSWIRQQELVPNATGVQCDRQWTAAYGAGIVVHTARCGGAESVWRSTNSGASFSGPTSAATNVDAAGPPVFSSAGVLYLPYTTATQVRVAKSTNNGSTWTNAFVASYSGRILFWPSLDADSTGNVYVAWSESPVAAGLFYPVPPTGGTVNFSRSTNAGVSWTTPRAISAAGRTAIFPWVTAGITGRVDISFYAADAASTNVSQSPDLGTPLTIWNVETAQTLTGTAATPAFSSFKVVANFHTGSICTEGLYCAGPQNVGLVNAPTPFDRRVLDFFETAAGANGLLMIVYPKDRPAIDTGALLNPLQPVVDIMLVRQTGGDKIR